MFRKTQKQAARRILDIVNNRVNNNKCGECDSEFPTWASSNLGILLCGRCASSHRKVLSISGPNGGPISQVKSLTLEAWSEDDIDRLGRIGNKRAALKWNPKQVPFPYDDDDDRPIEEFLRDKYVHCKFRNDRASSSDYLAGDADAYSDHSGHSTPHDRLGKSRSRSSSTVFSGGARARSVSTDVPRLSHRKPTSFEETHYRAKANSVAKYGYSNRDAVIESLVLSDGDVELALDILHNDAKVNPSSAELPPGLPRRPTTQPSQVTQTTQATNTPATSAGSATSDWWTGQTRPYVQAQATAAAQPQIYQYTDPVTGQVSYVDANGQQYLDPSNPQHQQLLAQQTNPQFLAQQATKQNIMSLYNQPEQYAAQTGQPPMQQQVPSQIQQQQFQAQALQQAQYAQQPQYTGAVYAGGQVDPNGQQQAYAQPGAQQQYGQQQYGQQQYWG